MKCFVHSDAVACGMCKSCHKGLCAECAFDSGEGLACKDSCEEKVDELNEMVSRSKKIYSIGTKPPLLSTATLMYLMFGILFIGYGAYRFFVTEITEGFSLLMGTAMLVMFAYALNKQRQTRLNC